MKLKLAVLASMAVGLFAILGPASAMAESTQLCTTDEEPCTTPATHLHHTGAVTLLSTAGTVGCSALYLGDTNGSLASQQSTKGAFTFSNCLRNGTESCTVTEKEEEKPGEIEREGHEFGWWHIHIYITWRCGNFINCTYRLWVWWWWWGPLLSEKANGTLEANEVTLEKSSGLFCPSTAKFDGELAPLSSLYIKS